MFETRVQCQSQCLRRFFQMKEDARCHSSSTLSHFVGCLEIFRNGFQIWQTFGHFVPQGIDTIQ